MPIRISVDDGCASDLRIADLAKKYNIEVIFYIPVEWTGVALRKGYEPLTSMQLILLAQEFEIGSHGITHEHLTKLPKHIAEEEIASSKYLLESIVGQSVRKFCPSRGYITPELMKYALEWYDEVRLTKGKHLVHIHPDSGVNNNRPWRECINKRTTELWCHSWELDKYNLWDELEGFLRERR